MKAILYLIFVLIFIIVFEVYKVITQRRKMKQIISEIEIKKKRIDMFETIKYTDIYGKEI